MVTETIYGLYQVRKNQKAAESDLCMDFVVPLELVSEWKRCSLVADFLAQYEAHNYKNKKFAISILSTIINELLENAVKFSSDRNKLVNLGLRHDSRGIIIETINTANAKQAEKLTQFITKIHSSNLEELFIEQIEKAAAGTDKTRSGLGLINILKDYESEVGFKIIPKDNDGEEFDIYVMVLIQSKLMNGE